MRDFTSTKSDRNDINAIVKTIVEVQFDDESKIGDCFESALKAWRINEPTLI